MNYWTVFYVSGVWWGIICSEYGLFQASGKQVKHYLGVGGGAWSFLGWVGMEWVGGALFWVGGGERKKFFGR